MHAYTVLRMWADEGKLALAYPARVNDQPTVICTKLNLKGSEAALALIDDPEIRVLYHLYVLSELKSRAMQLALESDARLEL